MSASTENTAIENQNSSSFLSKIALIEIGLLELGIVAFALAVLFFTLNYFNILQISALFPQQFGWLPHQASTMNSLSSQQKTSYNKSSYDNQLSSTTSPISYKDIFIWEGWPKNPKNDGSSISISGDTNGGWVAIGEDVPKTNQLHITGDFSVSFTMNFVAHPLGNPSVKLLFYSRSTIEQPNPSYILFYIGNDKKFTLTASSVNFPKQIIATSQLPSSGKITLLFKNVGKNNPETLEIIDQATNQATDTILLPFIFFPSSSIFNMGLEAGSGIASFDLNHFEITALHGEESIQKL